MIFYFGSFRDLIGPAKPVRITAVIMIFCNDTCNCCMWVWEIFNILYLHWNFKLNCLFLSDFSANVLIHMLVCVSFSTHSVFSAPVRSFKCPYWSIVVISYHFHFFRHFGNFFLKIFIGASIVFILVFCNKYFTVRSISYSFYLSVSH